MQHSNAEANTHTARIHSQPHVENTLNYPVEAPQKFVTSNKKIERLYKRFGIFISV